ncbi:PREDICTED: glutamate receptor 1.3-like isoform X2 [Ipomoea nil]|uniref:glutamate receptor 1.3-like isoform X2 n=1 Tax=Ipomoea nil TaxID=35883 RepID=UPI0009008ECA|nr:PREDICTED: glutamate receptor 1.3-like isoform X2 [Ipomoea nil]
MCTAIIRLLILVMSVIALSFGGEPAADGGSCGPSYPAKFEVGLVVDERSPVGKVVRKTVEMAVDEFYGINTDYETKINLHLRNSSGDPLLAFANAVDLLENVKVGAIIVPELWNEVTLFARLSDKARVPMFSFSSVLSPNAYPYFVQISQDEDTGLEGIVAFVKRANWSNVVLIHDGTEYGMKDLSRMIDLFQEGSLGFKPYIPASGKLQNFTLKWLRKSNIEASMELNVFGLWGYDAVWALAMAIEKAGKRIPPTEERCRDLLNLTSIAISSDGSSLVLEEVLNSRFVGLSGEFQFQNGKLASKTCEVVNVIGPGGRRAGFWTMGVGFTIQTPSMNFSSDLDSIIWPGPSLTIPTRDWLGKMLRVAVPWKQVFKEFVQVHHDVRSNTTSIKGFSVDVFLAAVESLSYELSFEFVPYLVVDDNGTRHSNYNELVYQLYLQKFDVVVGDITITSNRSSYADFAMPYTDLGVGTVARLSNTGPWFFLQPFNIDLWMMIAGSFIMTGVIVWMIEHERNEEFQGSLGQQIGTVLWFASSTLVYAHRERLVSNWSRFVVSVWLFVVLIISSSYTATLSSLLTLERIKFAKGDYLGYRYISEGVVFNNTNFADARLRRYHSPEDYREALSRGSEKGGVGGIMDEIPYLKCFLAKYPSEYALVGTAPTTNGFAFAFQKGSALVPEISEAIVRLREEGKLKELEDKWFKNQSSLLPLANAGTQLNTLSLDNFRGLFLVSGTSKAIAFIVFTIFALNKKLSIYHHILKIALGGNLAFMIRYLLPANAIDGINA